MCWSAVYRVMGLVFGISIYIHSPRVSESVSATFQKLQAARLRLWNSLNTSRYRRALHLPPSNPPSPALPSRVTEYVISQSPSLLEALSRQFSAKTVKTRQGALVVLTTYCRSTPSAIPSTLPHVGNVLAATLEDPNTEAGLKLEVTGLVQAALDGLGVPVAAA